MTGNTATVAATFGDFTTVFRVVDASTDTVAIRSVLGLLGPEACDAPPVSPVASLIGDIVVHDALALPTLKDRCKNGGWRSFGVFKDQGDCVSFVATGGKNPPAKRP